MVCPNCASNVDPQAGFCQRCGAKLTPMAQAVAPGQQVTDGKAVGSLILGILAILGLSIFAGIPAVILGHLSRSAIARSMGRLKGGGMALAGLIMGYLSALAIPMILIIAAIAIPNLLSAKMHANESASAATVRTIHTSIESYKVMYDAYPPTLRALASDNSGQASAQAAGLLDSVTASGFKYGYVFTYTLTDPEHYTIHADPTAEGSTGTSHFYADQTGIVRHRRGRRADADSPPI